MRLSITYIDSRAILCSFGRRVYGVSRVARPLYAIRMTRLLESLIDKRKIGREDYVAMVSINRSEYYFLTCR